VSNPVACGVVFISSTFPTGILKAPGHLLGAKVSRRRGSIHPSSFVYDSRRISSCSDHTPSTISCRGPSSPGAPGFAPCNGALDLQAGEVLIDEPGVWVVGMFVQGKVGALLKVCFEGKSDPGARNRTATDSPLVDHCSPARPR
jgi:hypothetical protein